MMPYIPDPCFENGEKYVNNLQKETDIITNTMECKKKFSKTIDKDNKLLYNICKCANCLSVYFRQAFLFHE